MKLLSAATVAASTIAVLALAVPMADAATPAVQITRVQYDSPGTDNRTNASLNAEWVQVKNTTRAAINMRGWTVRDAAAHVYTFGSYSLGAGKVVLVRTGTGVNGQHLYWRSGAYIWNNDRDSAYLRNAAGRAVDSCTWTRPGAGYTFC
jgi:Lamin Tail Domain